MRRRPSSTRCTPSASHLRHSRLCERVDDLRRRIEEASRTTPPPEYPAGLSPREVEVQPLVAEGLTDAEIANKLFVSRRTVTSHLTNIFNKLGVSARAAAVAHAARHGITL